MNTFKKVLMYISLLLFLLLLVGGLYYFNSYKVLSKRYIEYQQKVSDTLKENEDLNKNVQELVQNISVLQQDKNTLLTDLATKQTKIIEKEKIVYKDGALNIPEEYQELKDNYTVLSDIYEQKSNMYDSLLEQSEKDTKTIDNLLTTVSDLQNENNALADLLKQKISMPIPFFQHSISAGVGFGINGFSQLDIGYQLTVMNKYTGQIILGYPLSITFLVGIKL